MKPTRAVRIHLHPTDEGLAVCMSTADDRHLAYTLAPSERLALARYLITSVETDHRYADLALPLKETAS